MSMRIDMHTAMGPPSEAGDESPDAAAYILLIALMTLELGESENPLIVSDAIRQMLDGKNPETENPDPYLLVVRGAFEALVELTDDNDHLRRVLERFEDPLGGYGVTYDAHMPNGTISCATPADAVDKVVDHVIAQLPPGGLGARNRMSVIIRLSFLQVLRSSLFEKEGATFAKSDEEFAITMYGCELCARIPDDLRKRHLQLVP